MNLQTAELPIWLTGHPLIQSILDERADVTLKQRQAARSALDKATRDLEKALPGLQAKIETAKKNLADFESQKPKLFDSLAAAMAAKRTAVNDFERAKQAQEAVLLQTHDPAIDQTLEFFRNQLSELQHSKRIKAWNIKKTDKNPVNFKQEVCKYSNYEAILVALGYCRAAIDELQAMKLNPKLDTELIETLKSGIPSTEIFDEWETYENPII